MARSRVGGTKGLLNGRIANEVFTIRKDSKGNFVQIVSAIPEGVERTLTPELAKQRMAMSVVERAMGAMSKIVQHSFEGYTRPEEAVAAWASVNIKRVQEDMAARWDGLSFFSYPIKGVTGFCPGPFQISQGTLDFDMHAQVAWALQYDRNPSFLIGPFNHQPTFGEFLDYTGMKRGDYYTWVCSFQGRNGSPYSVQYIRMTVGTNFSMKDKLTHSSVINLFNIESVIPTYIDMEYDSTWNKWWVRVWILSLDVPELGLMSDTGVIVSLYDNGIWRRNTEYMGGVAWEKANREKFGMKNPSEVWDTWYQEQ